MTDAELQQALEAQRSAYTAGAQDMEVASMRNEIASIRAERAADQQQVGWQAFEQGKAAGAVTARLEVAADQMLTSVAPNLSATERAAIIQNAGKRCSLDGSEEARAAVNAYMHAGDTGRMLNLLAGYMGAAIRDINPALAEELKCEAIEQAAASQAAAAVGPGASDAYWNMGELQMARTMRKAGYQEKPHTTSLDAIAMDIQDQQQRAARAMPRWKTPSARRGENDLMAAYLLRRGVAETIATFNAVGTAPDQYALPQEYIGARLSWQTVVTGGPSSVVAKLQASLDGANFSDLDTSNVAGGEVRVLPVEGIAAIKAALTTLSGGSSPTVTVKLRMQ